MFSGAKVAKMCPVATSGPHRHSLLLVLRKVAQQFLYGHLDIPVYQLPTTLATVRRSRP